MKLKFFAFVKVSLPEALAVIAFIVTETRSVVRKLPTVVAANVDKPVTFAVPVILPPVAVSLNGPIAFVVLLRTIPAMFPSVASTTLVVPP